MPDFLVKIAFRMWLGPETQSNRLQRCPEFGKHSNIRVDCFLYFLFFSMPPIDKENMHIIQLLVTGVCAIILASVFFFILYFYLYLFIYTSDVKRGFRVKRITTSETHGDWSDLPPFPSGWMSVVSTVPNVSKPVSRCSIV